MSSGTVNDTGKTSICWMVSDVWRIHRLSFQTVRISKVSEMLKCCKFVPHKFSKHLSVFLIIIFRCYSNRTGRSPRTGGTYVRTGFSCFHWAVLVLVLVRCCEASIRFNLSALLFLPSRSPERSVLTPYGFAGVFYVWASSFDPHRLCRWDIFRFWLAFLSGIQWFVFFCSSVRMVLVNVELRGFYRFIAVFMFNFVFFLPFLHLKRLFSSSGVEHNSINDSGFICRPPRWMETRFKKSSLTWICLWTSERNSHESTET